MFGIYYAYAMHMLSICYAYVMHMKNKNVHDQRKADRSRLGPRTLLTSLQTWKPICGKKRSMQTCLTW